MGGGRPLDHHLRAEGRRARDRRRGDEDRAGRSGESGRARSPRRKPKSKPRSNNVLALLHRPADLRRGPVDLHYPRRPRVDARAADRPVPGDLAAGGHGDRDLPGRLGAGARVDGRRAARERDQRRRGHALHELDLVGERHGADPGHLQHRRRHRQGHAQRQQPRQAGRAEAAAGSAPPGHHGGEGLLGLPPGARVLLARRALRRHLHLELRDAERARRDQARARHHAGADLRRQGLRDAHLAAARPPRHAQARPGRRDPRGERAERSSSRRARWARRQPPGSRSWSTA